MKIPWVVLMAVVCFTGCRSVHDRQTYTPPTPLPRLYPLYEGKEAANVEAVLSIDALDYGPGREAKSFDEAVPGASPESVLARYIMLGQSTAQDLERMMSLFWPKSSVEDVQTHCQARKKFFARISRVLLRRRFDVENLVFIYCDYEYKEEAPLNRLAPGWLFMLCREGEKYYMATDVYPWSTLRKVVYGLSQRPARRNEEDIRAIRQKAGSFPHSYRLRPPERYGRTDERVFLLRFRGTRYDLSVSDRSDPPDELSRFVWKVKRAYEATSSEEINRLWHDREADRIDDPKWPNYMAVMRYRSGFRKMEARLLFSLDLGSSVAVYVESSNSMRRQLFLLKLYKDPKDGLRITSGVGLVGKGRTFDDWTGAVLEDSRFLRHIRSIASGETPPHSGEK